MSGDEQLTRQDVRRLSPEAVRAALHAGELDELLGRTSRRPERPPLDPDAVEQAAAAGRLDELLEAHRNWQPRERERLAAMSPDEIKAALEEGELDTLLRGEQR